MKSLFFTTKFAKQNCKYGNRLFASLSAISVFCMMPKISDALTMPTPLNIRAGFLGNITLSGALSGLVSYQSGKYFSGVNDKIYRAEIDNAIISIKKSSGVLRFTMLAGAYNPPSIFLPLVSTSARVKNSFGPLLQGYITIAPNKSFNIMIGKFGAIPGLQAFLTYLNPYVQHGVLGFQEPLVSRGVQLNYNCGNISTSFALTDGFYTNRYNYLTGQIIYHINRSNAFYVQAGGNAGNSSFAESSQGPQVNEDIYLFAYKYHNNDYSVTPTVLFTHINGASQVGFSKSQDTAGFSLVGDYHFTSHYSLGGRVDYLSSTGTPNSTGMNLTTFGPGSNVYNITADPTYQDGGFFTRLELSYTRVANLSTGLGFGRGMNGSKEFRIMEETGVLF